MQKVNLKFEVKSSGDRVMRCFVLESLIPNFPKFKTVAQLQEELKAHGFECSKKTIYRDMDLLSCFKPIVCKEESRPRGYSMCIQN